MLVTQIFQLENRVYRHFHFREITGISKRILKEILYRKFQEATSLDTQGLQGERKFEEKEIAEGVREMNFRKIFFRETTGEAEGENGEGNRRATKQVFGWYKFDGLPL